MIFCSLRRLKKGCWRQSIFSLVNVRKKKRDRRNDEEASTGTTRKGKRIQERRWETVWAVALFLLLCVLSKRRVCLGTSMNVVFFFFSLFYFCVLLLFYPLILHIFCRYYAWYFDFSMKRERYNRKEWTCTYARVCVQKRRRNRDAHIRAYTYTCDTECARARLPVTACIYVHCSTRYESGREKDSESGRKKAPDVSILRAVRRWPNWNTMAYDSVVGVFRPLVSLAAKGESLTAFSHELGRRKSRVIRWLVVAYEDSRKLENPCARLLSVLSSWIRIVD